MIHNEVVYLKKRKFKWSSSEANSLRFTFCTNNSPIYKANLDPKIVLFEKCLKQWQHRKLTLMGKITVTKNYALPKLIYALSSLPNPLPQTVKRIEILMYEFIWDGKPEKIKRNTVELRWLELVGTVGASSTHPCVRAIPSLPIFKLVHVYFMPSRTPRFLSTKGAKRT